MENNNIGIRIAELRRAQGMTQDQLAGRLGISFQAVSKWENGASCPDIMMLPQLAEIFGVSIDALFGRESQALAAVPDHGPAPFVGELPWPDDGGLYAVLYRGHRLLSCEGLEGGGAKHIHLSFEAAVNGIKRFFSRTLEQGFGGLTHAVELHYEGPVCNLTTSMSVRCENTRIEGNVQAGDGVNCGDVGGSVQAGDGANCGNVGGDVRAGDGVNCGDVSGSINAGDGVNCGNVGGDVRAGDNIRCGNVEGDVQAGDAVSCGDVHGDVRCDGDVRCGRVDGDVHAGGDVYLRRE